MGKPTATVFRCAVCGAKQEAAGISREATCVKCKAELRTCTHCRHFDSSRPNECRKPVTARVGSKAKANDCELFEAKESQEFAAEAPSTNDAKSAFDALFKF